ncbi:MAG: polynucleotide adenylyltransferase PcnB, partial [Planctomycetota bacterium]
MHVAAEQRDGSARAPPLDQPLDQSREGRPVRVGGEPVLEIVAELGKEGNAQEQLRQAADEREQRGGGRHGRRRQGGERRRDR